MVLASSLRERERNRVIVSFSPCASLIELYCRCNDEGSRWWLLIFPSRQTTGRPATGAIWILSFLFLLFSFFFWPSHVIFRLRDRKKTKRDEQRERRKRIYLRERAYVFEIRMEKKKIKIIKKKRKKIEGGRGRKNEQKKTRWMISKKRVVSRARVTSGKNLSERERERGGETLRNDKRRARPVQRRDASKNVLSLLVPAFIFARNNRGTSRDGESGTHLLYAEARA